MKINSLRVLLIAVPIILASTLLASLAGCSSSTAAPATQSSSTSKPTASGTSITLKWTTLEPDAPSSNHDLTLKFANEVDQQTQGRVKIKVYWGGVLGAPQNTLKMLQTGVADMAYVIPTYLQWNIPLFAATGLPFITTGYQVGGPAAWALYQQWPAMQQEWTKVGIKPLWYAQPFEHWLGVTQPIKTLNDLKGKKLWAGGFWPDMIKQFGIIDVPMNAMDAYTALQKGVIVGVINPYMTFKTIRYYEVTKYMVKWPFGGQPVNAWVISQNAWNKISPADQKTILNLVSGLNSQYYPAMKTEGDGLTKFFTDNGVHFITFSDAEYAQDESIGKPAVWNDWLATAKQKGVPGQEFLDKYQAMVKKLAAKTSRTFRPVPVVA